MAEHIARVDGARFRCESEKAAKYAVHFSKTALSVLAAEHSPITMKALKEERRRMKREQRIGPHSTKPKGTPKTSRSTKAKGIDWDAQPLGEMPDMLLADKLGVAKNSVAHARKARGILAYKEDEPDWDEMRLGDLHDSEIAEQTGFSRAYIRKVREGRGIPAKVFRDGGKGIDWGAQPLGEIPDETIARRLGCSRPSVTLARQRRGIESFRLRERREAKSERQPKN